MRKRSFPVLRFLAVISSALLALPALSFEVRGFRSCMSLAEAQSVAVNTGRSLKRDHPMPLEDGTMVEFYSVSADPDLNSLIFSDGKLIRIGVIKKGEYDAFATLLETLIQELGQPRLEAGARYSIVMATWSTGGSERKTLSISKPVDAISVAVLDWIDRSACN